MALFIELQNLSIDHADRKSEPTVFVDVNAFIQKSGLGRLAQSLAVYWVAARPFQGDGEYTPVSFEYPTRQIDILQMFTLQAGAQVSVESDFDYLRAGNIYAVTDCGRDYHFQNIAPNGGATYISKVAIKSAMMRNQVKFFLRGN